jgi:alanyl-tRNA synthetase
MPSANEIRQQFIDFFVNKHGHTAVPSSPVVPQDDPTLLFTNAGMNQFKDVFLGTGTRPYKRAVDSQKCIRAGGKHNDLEDVGRDTYHHTFFEMLGNWSFGDYFKKEAIAWAWELLTKVWKLDKSRLHATVFEGDPEAGLARDDEAAEFWRTQTDIDPSHIHLGSKKDNFWMMGDTGPCGPCSEIHYDRTPDRSGSKLVNKGDARVIEIWNLVFIQFNRDESGKLHPLPAKHVDTGMGFERITAVLQGKESNYDTDVFTPIMEAIGILVGKKYGGKLDNINDVAFRVIADHLRMLTFAITDGALPGNKGRGAVLRSVLRRAFRFGYQRFGQREPFIWKLVPALVEHMGGAYPELKKNPARVHDILKGEESDFLRTIERGLALYQKAAEEAKREGGIISGKSVFDLYTTHGFPPDLTRQMAEEEKLTIDQDEYDRLWTIFTTQDPVRSTAQVATNVSGDLPATDDRPKWLDPTCEGTILGWIADSQFHKDGRLPETEVGLILDKTCFYAEQGGQVGDQGTIRTPTGLFQVTQTVKVGNAVVHLGQVTEGRVAVGQKASLSVTQEREFTRKNHTATHLLHWALHKVLGEHVEQRGSKVKPDEFTFDFSHTGPMTEAEKAEVERLVNEKIYQDLPVQWRELPIAEAKKLSGVRAFFGDKYGDVVRVVEIHDSPPSPPQRGRGVGGEGAEVPTPSPPTPLPRSGGEGSKGALLPRSGGEGSDDVFSREFCGGTHLDHTGQAGFFKIISEEAVGKGVRRLTCVTAREAVKAVQKEDAILADLTARFRCKPEELPARIDSLQDEIKKLSHQLKKGAATDLQAVADKLLADAPEMKGSRVIVGEMPAAPDEQMRQQVDRLRQKAPSAVVVLGWSDDGKVGLMAAVTDDLVKRGLHAGKLVGQVASVVGGKGGGKPTMAQAGGKEPAKLGEALALARRLASEQLSK